ncbi:hypothetical protein SSX86_001602 [Deinandra increscens subsp. villosa]|uniref:Mediator complex subunit 15 KIX domain-containing protein n=1 Tax=Deinandra increscens subsp. villosa TaxID=3103831 RepID=A0AAP0DVN1_9ASTR
MDKSNWRPTQGASSGGDSSMESVDRRRTLLPPPDARHKIVNRLMDNLKKHVQFSGQEKLHELKDIALRLEEKIYTAATNQDDYLRKISMKLMSMENRSANPVPNSLQSNSACNTTGSMQQLNNQGQTPPPISVPSNHSQAGKQIIHNNVSSSGVPPGSQSSSLQNIPNLSVGNNMGHGIPPNNFVSQRKMPGSQNSQHYLYQQQSHQIAKQKLQQNSINSNNVQSHMQQQHQMNILQPAHSHFQPSQLQVVYNGFGSTWPTMLQPSSLSTMKQNQQPHFPQSGQPMSQQLVLRQQQRQQQPRIYGQQSNLSNVQSIGQHNNKFSMIHQQHLGSQSSQKQQQSLGTQSGNNTMLNNQHSSHLMPSAAQSQRSQVELQTQSAQFQHQLNMKQRHPTPFHQQRAMAEASSTSSDSTAHTANPNSGDWQEEVKAMKNKYLPELNDIYQNFVSRLQQYKLRYPLYSCLIFVDQHDSLHQQPISDQIEKLKKIKHMLECCMKFLQLPKSNISPNHKETLGAYEREIVILISRHNRKPGPTPQQQQRMNSLPQSQQNQIQFTQVQPHENQMNSQMQSVNLQHNSLATLHHNSVSNAQQNMMGMLQQPNSHMLPLKHLQTRQMQQQLMHKQQLLHHHQFHPQTKHNVTLKVNQVSQLHQRNDGNELKVTPQIDMKSDSLKQLKIDQENVLNSVTKSSTPLQPANSPFIVSSPSTPSMSNLPGDTDKLNSGVLLPAIDGKICTPGISASPLLAECTNPDATIVSGKSTTIEEPLDHLLKVVKSISPKSLTASVTDIGSVLSMIDSIAGSPPGNGSRTAIGEDLVAMTKATTTGKRKMNHFTNPMFINVVSTASRVNDSFNYLENSELESTATSTIKRHRVEMEHSLLEEIREINQGLIDTVVDISQENVDPETASEVGKGTIVKCSFSAVALCPNLKSRYASVQMSPIQPLRLLVPANYPNSSPILLDKLPVEVRHMTEYLFPLHSKEYEDLSIKAKWRFSSYVRRLSDPMSLEKMARTWDVCARAVILERVQQSGGGTFTSKHGAWEDCLIVS